MNKQEFLAELRKNLHGLPSDEIEERLNFYSEIIDDRTEEGESEETAVAELGTIQEIVSQIMSEIPLTKLVKEKTKNKRALKVWEIILLAVGSPIWLSLLIAVLAVVLSLYVVIWMLAVSLCAIEFTFVASSVGGIVSSVVFLIEGHNITALTMFGATLICIGLAVFMYYGCKQAVKGILKLSKKTFILIKSCFTLKKEVSE